MKCHGIGVVVFYMLISVNKSSMNCSFKQVTSLISLCYGAPLLLINKTTSVSYTFSLGDIGAFFPINTSSVVYWSQSHMRFPAAVNSAENNPQRVHDLL